MRFRFLFFWITICFSLVLVSCSNPNSDSTKKRKLKVGHLVALDMAPTFVAKEAGYFDEVGLDVELLSFGPYGNDKALAKGEIDISITPFTLPYIARKNGVPIKAVASAGGWGVMEVVIQGSYQIRSIQQLATYVKSNPKKKIKIATYKGDSIDLLLIDGLKKEGLTYDDFEVIWFDNIFEMVEAFKREEIGILTHIKPYTTDMIKNYGANHLLDSSKVWDFYTSNCVVGVLVDLLENEPKVIEKYLKALIKAAHLINNNPDKAVRLLEESEYTYFKVDYETVLHAFKTQPAPISFVPRLKSMNLVTLKMVQLGYIDKYISGNKVFDLEIIKKLEGNKHDR